MAKYRKVLLKRADLKLIATDAQIITEKICASVAGYQSESLNKTHVFGLTTHDNKFCLAKNSNLVLASSNFSVSSLFFLRSSNTS